MSVQPKDDQHKNTEPGSKARLRLWVRILGISKLVQSDLRKQFLDQFDTKLSYFDLMSALARFESGLKMSEISGLLRVSNGNVTGLVDQLVDKGIALRAEIPGDRRAHLVRLTKKGKEEFDRLAQAHESWIDEMFAELSADEASALYDALTALSRKLEEGEPS